MDFVDEAERHEVETEFGVDHLFEGFVDLLLGGRVFFSSMVFCSSDMATS